MYSHFEINISKRGNHFFATAPRSCTSLEKTREIFLEMFTKFPPHEGYKISVSYFSGVYHQIDFTDNPEKQLEKLL